MAENNPSLPNNPFATPPQKKRGRQKPAVSAAEITLPGPMIEPSTETMINRPKSYFTQAEQEYISEQLKIYREASRGPMDMVVINEAVATDIELQRVYRQLAMLEPDGQISVTGMRAKQRAELGKRRDELVDRWLDLKKHLKDAFTGDTGPKTLADIHVKYKKILDARRNGGEVIVGAPSQEALALAQAEGLDPERYKIDGAMPDDARQEFLDDGGDPKKKELALAMMVDDFLHDPVLAVMVIFGGELPPNQQLRLFGMWKYPFMIDSSGFGTGKTRCTALVAALRCLLMVDRVVGIISLTLRQGVLYFRDYFDPWIKNNPFFRSQIAVDRTNRPKSVHSNDGCELTFLNNNRIRTIPPGFMNNADRAASESWTDGSYDEWVRYGNFDALRVLKGRVRRPIPECYDVEDPIYAAHACFCGTADFTWHPAYSYVKTYMEEIAKGSKSHELQSWNYTHYPKRCYRLINLPMIEDMKRTMSRDQVEREIYGHWVNDSSGYYSAREIKDCRKPDCPVLVA